MSERRNRLAEEASPYLRQHAGNPVAWQPWDERALAEARAEDKPIFLSIGYATCHWCHVMADESFSDPAVATLLNDAFICIKVDREERPDLDTVYMRACQAMTGSGGWPLNVFLAPDGRPFYAATYLAKDSQPGRGGLIDVGTAVRELWRTRRDDLLKGADELMRIISSSYNAEGLGTIDEALLNKCFGALALEFDPKNGGFGSAPKFPSVPRLLFLLRYWLWTGDRRALGIAELSLERMHAGGIYDHVGGGFHRYSTDDAWQVPHFEKMLYDQALMAYVYTEAWQATGRGDFLSCAAETLAYVLRDLRAPSGGFYSAEDADSEGEEGRFYFWNVAELRELLDEADADLAILAWGMKNEGNHQASESDDGHNILRQELPVSELGRLYEQSPEEMVRRLEIIREKLRLRREGRVHPAKDGKVLTDWNGLAIAALAKYGRCSGSDEHVAAAHTAADFMLREMRFGKRAALLHMSGGNGGVAGMLDDYAFLIWGLLELYQASFEPVYLSEAQSLATLLTERFQSPQGAFFLTGEDDPSLIVRPRTVFDGALPSGNSVAIGALLTLARICGNLELENVVRKACAAFVFSAEQAPAGHSYFLMAAGQFLCPSQELVLVGERKELAPFLDVLGCRNPQLSLLLKTPDTAKELERIAPHTAAMTLESGKPAAFLCRNYACLPPVHSPEDLLKLITVDKTKRS